MLNQSERKRAGVQEPKQTFWSGGNVLMRGKYSTSAARIC